jgi:PRTRC genetic system protein C
MEATTMARSFRYNGAKLPDPNPMFSPEQVREFYAPTYPEIANAAIDGPEATGGELRFTFTRAVGTKG